MYVSVQFNCGIFCLSRGCKKKKQKKKEEKKKHPKHIFPCESLWPLFSKNKTHYNAWVSVTYV